MWLSTTVSYTHLDVYKRQRLDNTYPYTHLSGCGVGFKFMQAFAISNGIEFHHLIPLLDIVAVSIASDIVPIMGENRILAFHGLKQLNLSLIHICLYVFPLGIIRRL